MDISDLGDTGILGLGLHKWFSVEVSDEVTEEFLLLSGAS